MKTLFQKKYSDESLYDLEEDIHFALAADNPKFAEIPVDDNGFREGTFIVTIKHLRRE